jgi:RNA polymerase sigma-70 factor (ECF subfamily)
MPKVDLATPDEVLAVAAMLGDLDAFDTLALRYRSGVVRAAQAIVGRDDSEDVAQEALLLAFKALPSLEEPGKFAPWLYAITRHFALRFDRRERARSRGRVAIDDLLLERIAALARPMINWEEEELQRALESISPDHALALRLHFLDGMPLKHLAAFLGVSLTTAKWRVHRGKKLLRDKIELLQRNKGQWKESKRLRS